MFTDDATLKAHLVYRAAKAGNQVAAVNLVWNLAADYIQRAGGLITAVVTLVNAGRIKTLRGEPRVIKKLQERNAHEILDIFGIQPGALTANEAQYLVGFRTPDEIRNRLAKARKEINRRLRSKGIRWADERKDAGDA